MHVYHDKCLGSGRWLPNKAFMDGIGSRLRARARALGLSDAEIARRLGFGPSRYTNYISDLREPDFATLLRICELLETTPNAILGVDGQGPPPTGMEVLRERIAAAARAMDADTLRLAAEVMNALATRTTKRHSDDQ